MSTIEKVIGQEKVSECITRVQELVDVWMRDNDVHRWEDLLAPNEFSVIDTDYFEDIRTGATKIVLLPKDASYVVKIPYIGEENWDWGGEPHWFDGGSYNDDGEPYDYCAYEAYLYDEAKFFGCDQFFVPTAYLLSIGNIPIYIQSRIDYKYHPADPSNEDTYRYASIKNSEVLIPEVGTRLLEYYTSDEIATFLSFIKECDVNDLEVARNGEYVEAFGRYVFWDYSGYRENGY